MPIDDVEINWMDQSATNWYNVFVILLVIITVTQHQLPTFSYSIENFIANDFIYYSNENLVFLNPKAYWCDNMTKNFFSLIVTLINVEFSLQQGEQKVTNKENMSNDKDITAVEGENEVESNYQPPPQKTIEEIVAADQEDESLRKYKEALLGAAQSEKIIVGE